MAIPHALDTVVFARGLQIPRAGGPSWPGIDFEVDPGEIFVLVGTAVAEKTALLDVLAGLRSAQAAELTVCGVPPTRLHTLSPHTIGMALRGVAFERGLTVSETIALFSRFSATPIVNLTAAISLLRLEDDRRARVSSLPPDRLQRLLLTVALMHDPVVFVADDPARELDLEGRQLLWDVLVRRRERGRTSIFTTEHVDEIERIADRVAVFDGARLAAVDSPEGLLRACTSPVTITFDLAQPAIAVDVLRHLDGAAEVEVRAGRYTILSRAGVHTIRALVRLLDGLGTIPESLTMRRPTLADAVLDVSARSRTP